MSTDERYMRLAIKLAKRAEGLTNPNPLVGAVIVKNNRIIGKGYHKKCGLPHAEVNALEKAGRHAKGAILYVTLEPCDHFGRTAPCTDAVIRSGVKTVMIAMKDPNPVNNGRGINKLNKHGIKTTTGILRKEAITLNRPYIKFITKKMPYITLKLAESLDGKIATRTGDSKWITQEDSRRYGHELRGKVDVVMVGVNTVIKDDPLLTSKIRNAKQPIRIILDDRLRTPLGAKIFTGLDKSPVIIATTRVASKNKVKLYTAEGAEVVMVKSKKGKVDLTELFKMLGKMNVMHILVEGGGQLAASIVEERLADHFLFFIAPKIIGGRNAITSVEGIGAKRVRDALILKNIRIKKFKKDILIEAEAN